MFLTQALASHGARECRPAADPGAVGSDAARSLLLGSVLPRCGIRLSRAQCRDTVDPTRAGAAGRCSECAADAYSQASGPVIEVVAIGIVEFE